VGVERVSAKTDVDAVEGDGYDLQQHEKSDPQTQRPVAWLSARPDHDYSLCKKFARDEEDRQEAANREEISLDAIRDVGAEGCRISREERGGRAIGASVAVATMSVRVLTTRWILA
jgi:hypothetical protein